MNINQPQRLSFELLRKISTYASNRSDVLNMRTALGRNGDTMMQAVLNNFDSHTLRTGTLAECNQLINNPNIPHDIILEGLNNQNDNVIVAVASARPFVFNREQFSTIQNAITRIDIEDLRNYHNNRMLRRLEL